MRKNNKLQQLSVKPFNDIYKACEKIAKDFGVKTVALSVVDELANILIENTNKINDPDLEDFKKKCVGLVLNLKKFCKNSANKMKSKHIPLTLLKQYIDAITQGIKEGFKNRK